MKFPGRKYRPAFEKYGGHYHFRVSTVEDLKYIISLPDGRWMATSCPTFGINLDPAFLRFLDSDGNNRIISEDIRVAARWLLRCLRPSGTWLDHSPNLSLELINTDSPEGRDLRDAADLVLKNLGLADSKEISLEQVRNRQKIMAQADYNGDGVIPPEVVKEPEAAQFIRDLIASVGSVADASGLKGVNVALMDQFRKDASVYTQWFDQGIIPEGQSQTPIMPFGAETPKMFQAIAAIREKVEQFFAQCALVRFDSAMAQRLSPKPEEIAKLDYRERETILEHLRLSPLAVPNADGILPLPKEAFNEFYAVPINNLREQVAVPVFGEGVSELSESQWRQILSKFAPYEKWFKSKPAVTIEPLGIAKIRAYLNSPHDAAIRELIVIDKAVMGEIQQLQNLEKLILYHQWLFEFVNNYVSFPHLFNPVTRATFEMGKLILSGREFEFGVRVENRVTHSTIAKNSGIFLIYLQIMGAKPEDVFEIAVPVTRGNGKNFYVGQRGVFFTTAGRELDAQIVQILENPISLWDSIKDPFRRIYSLLGGRISLISASIQRETEKTITATTSDQQIIQKEVQNIQQETPAQAPPPAAPPAQPTAAAVPTRNSSSARDLMVGTGLLVAGLGTALKFLVDAAKQLAQPRTLQVLLIMIGVFVSISVIVAAVTAWRKLRQRDLGVLLQASGWAINGRMRLIIPMARIFCRKAPIPKGASKHRRELIKHFERIARRMQKKGDSA